MPTDGLVRKWIEGNNIFSIGDVLTRRFNKRKVPFSIGPRFHGHHKLNEFIVTQHPTEKDQEDFWRMLWDHSAQTVVLLSAIEQVSPKHNFCSLTVKNGIFH
jgi:hypothetical protein